MKYEGNPIILNSGAVDVEFLNGKYIMLEESQQGILYRIGSNETSFSETPRFLFKNTGTSFDGYGHVTPFILIKDGKWIATYTGPATVKGWNQNRIDVWYPMANISITASNVDGQALSAANSWALSPRTMMWMPDKDWMGNEFSFTITSGTSSEVIGAMNLSEDNAMFTIGRMQIDVYPEIEQAWAYNEHYSHLVFGYSYTAAEIIQL